MKRVLLINMPFAPIRHPAIGISLLKSRLREEGIQCDIKYLNIVFAKMIGFDRNESVCNNYYWKVLVGERLFAQEYFAEQLPDEQEYIRYLKQIYRGSSNYLDNFLSIKGFIRPFIDSCMESISWSQYDIIGFTTMFEQNLASIVLAHRIKLLDSTKIIVFGGANCEQKMGLELHRCFPIIDYICSGEADISFPELVNKLRKQISIERIPGIVYRCNEKSILIQGDTSVKNLDELPCPDYDDYFAQLEHATFSPTICTELFMETSRGCWWGERSQCMFCGLNGGSIRFRSKSKDRIISELCYLKEKYVINYNIPQFLMTDNILDMKYFKELLPELRKSRLNVKLFYETKANLNKEQVKMLSDAGINSIQPGIESLNTHVLRLMHKGVSAIQNIQLLKYCKQFDIFPVWAILTGLPGEKIKDYEQTVEFIYKITHLEPPGVYGRFVLQRFSPYFDNPGKHGIMNIRPESGYRFIYPFEISSLLNLAYHFEFDYKEAVKPPDYDKQLTKALDYWKACYANNETLYTFETSPSTLLIKDTRSNAIVSQTVLESAQKDIYEYCDKIQNFSSIFSHIRERYSSYPVKARDIKDFLREMVNLNLMVNEENNYLSLAIPSDEKTPIV
ncbi:MAG: RiPP maturation radical SAM C-methyltransferase [Candidatus Loosdrechtia sp.]|uniref:RiPP maturation radical SAM C-methyltransferase n=1 Tax=Candidatus Loosdrechtia sp. TaxID=3101272 RepID=UPI003A6F2F52|nr:MAG: RiPP maturation radical SAM C-methyltransferase [Candidatus Jettenia sp. AMX2]